LGRTLGLFLMLLLGSAGSAFASAEVRFVHAVPGAGPATLNVSVEGAGVSSSGVNFGKVAEPLEIDSGDAKLTVAPGSGDAAVAEAQKTLVDGASYTVVALPQGKGGAADLRVFKDAKPRAGQARIRAIHAGPELGEPDVRLGDRTIAEQLGYGDATDYAEVSPGTHDVTITRAGGEGGELATKKDAPLTAGTATTAVVIGSRGEPTRILTISDGTAAPKGPGPATGLGGLAGDGGGPSRLVVALLFGVFAAALGAGGWVLSGRR